MNFVLIKTVEDENWWINPTQIYGINKNEVGRMEIYLQDDILETSEFDNPGDLMDYLGIQYNSMQIEETGTEEEDND
jgi:hypothetical protein